MKSYLKEISIKSTILIIGNNVEHLYRTLKSFLNKEKIVIRSEKKGKEFFLKNTPDLVILEVSNNESSLKLLRHLKSIKPSVPVIVFTSTGSEDLAVKVFRWGVWDYFALPFNEKEFQKSVLSALGMEYYNYDQRYWYGLLKALKFINERYTEQLRLTDIAKIACMSVSTFERIFKKEMGVTFTMYVNRLRITKAIKLLKEDLSMSEIAFSCGFTNQFHFSRVFKKIMQVSPRDYKRSLK